MNNKEKIYIIIAISLAVAFGIIAYFWIIEQTNNMFKAYGEKDKNKDMINDLIKTGKFTEDEAKDFISKTIQNKGDSTSRINQVHGQIDNESLLSNGYDVKHLQGQNITELLNNNIYGEGDPEITCTGVSWMNQTSTSCSLLNLTKLNEEFDKLSNDVDHARDDFLNNVTKNK